MLVDSHCHLDRLDLTSYENGLDDALVQARARGVSHMLCVCISDENRVDVLNIARGHADISASVGVHPSDVRESVITPEILSGWADDPSVVALGETGLDYYYTEEFKSQQQASFVSHLETGAKIGLPVIVHTRDARDDTLRLIRDHASHEHAGVLHCFTESMDMARAALDLNFYISLSGIVTFKNAEALREVARFVPADRLLVETDSPYLAPVPFRGKPNEPRYVREVAEFVAEQRGVDYAQFAAETTENFFRLFPRARPSA